MTRAGAGTSAACDTTGVSLITAQVAADGAPPDAPTDNMGNTYLPCSDDQTGFFTGHTETFCCENPIVGPGHTWSIAGAVPGMAIAAWSGIDIANAADRFNGADSVSNGGKPGILRPTRNKSLVIIGIGGAESSAPSATGYTVAAHLSLSGGVNYSASLLYKVQTIAVEENPAIVLGGSCGVTICSFNPQPLIITPHSIAANHSGEITVLIYKPGGNFDGTTVFDFSSVSSVVQTRPPVILNSQYANAFLRTI